MAKPSDVPVPRCCAQKYPRNSTLLIINKGGVRLLEGEIGAFVSVSDLKHANYMDQMRLEELIFVFFSLLCRLQAMDDHANGIRDEYRKIFFFVELFKYIIKIKLPCKAFANSLQFVIHNIVDSSPDFKMNQ
jgi:hypothetical protein